MANELKVREKVWLKLPYGNIFQKTDAKNNCVFIAGGTGVTPFLSLFNHSTFKKYVNPKLYLGFRTKEYNIFHNEIEKAKQNNPEFVVHLFYEDIDGMLNIEKIYNDNKNTIYFISGPPIMIKNFKNYLVQKGINDSKIITDDWE